MRLPAVIFVFLGSAALADVPKKVFKPYGFVALDLYYDSRQILGARDNFALLWPLRVRPDIFHQDINAHGGWNVTAIQTRMGLEIEQPWCWPDSSIKALIEGDFLGLSDQLTGDFRLRHANIFFKTKKWNLLAGQFWHPLFVPDCFPDTISFNNGLPMEPQARSPQLRFTYTPENFEFIVAALSQRDFASIGPIGSSTEYIRNSVTPNLHAQIKWYPPRATPRPVRRPVRHSLGDGVSPKSDDLSVVTSAKAEVLCEGRIGEDGTRGVDNEASNSQSIQPEPLGLLIGAAIDYLRLAPRINTVKGVATNETINSVITQVFAAINKKRYQIRTKVTYAQNANVQLMLSGFAVKTVDPVTDTRTYSNTASIAAWLDMAYWFYKETNSVGLFVGGAKNLGARHPLYIDPTTNQPIVYTFDPTINTVWRVAPRFRYKKAPWQVGLEFEITQASFGKMNRFAQIPHSRSAINYRVLFEILFLF